MILSSCIRDLFNLCRLRVWRTASIFCSLEIIRMFACINLWLKSIFNSCHDQLDLMFQANYFINIFDAQAIQFLSILSKWLTWPFALMLVIRDEIRIKVVIYLEEMPILANKYRLIILLQVVNKIPQKVKYLAFLHFLKNQVVKLNHLDYLFWDLYIEFPQIT